MVQEQDLAVSSTADVMEFLSDEDLVARCRSARVDTERDKLLNQLFARHHTRVTGWCYGITGDRDGATDLAQESLLKAFQHLDSFREQSKFTTWLYSIARNHCMDVLKCRAAAPTVAEEGVLERVEDGRAGEVLLKMERCENEQVVRQLMRESLDEVETRVMLLHYVDELPLAAVTKILGLSNASGAKAYVVSARRKLARAFDRWHQRKQRSKLRGIPK